MLAGCADPIWEDGSGSIMVVLSGDGGVIMMFIDENPRSHCCLYLEVEGKENVSETEGGGGRGISD